MGVSITFRHMDSSDAIKAYAREKIERTQKFLRAPVEAQVTLSTERHQFVAEVHLSAGGVSTTRATTATTCTSPSIWSRTSFSTRFRRRTTPLRAMSRAGMERQKSRSKRRRNKKRPDTETAEHRFTSRVQ